MVSSILKTLHEKTVFLFTSRLERFISFSPARVFFSFMSEYSEVARIPHTFVHEISANHA